MRQIDADALTRELKSIKATFGSGNGLIEGGLEIAISTTYAMPTVNQWIPCSERLPKHSYTKRFWLTVKLDDDEGTVTTLIGTWSAWGGGKGSEPYDAFDCWKDTMINGKIYRLSQPIPKEQVLAWMPLPEPWKGESND